MRYDVKTSTGVFCDRVFVFPVKVYYEDTDAGGIVYYANYLKFAERARSEYIQALNFNQQAELEASKCGFTVRKCEIEYMRPAVLGDDLVVTCEVRDIKGASAEMFQQVLRGEDLLATIVVKVAYVDLERKRPVRIPAELVKVMESK